MFLYTLGLAIVTFHNPPCMHSSNLLFRCNIFFSSHRAVKPSRILSDRALHRHHHCPPLLSLYIFAHHRDPTYLPLVASSIGFPSVYRTLFPGFIWECLAFVAYQNILCHELNLVRGAAARRTRTGSQLQRQKGRMRELELQC